MSPGQTVPAGTTNSQRVAGQLHFAEVRGVTPAAWIGSRTSPDIIEISSRVLHTQCSDKDPHFHKLSARSGRDRCGQREVPIGGKSPHCGCVSQLTLRRRNKPSVLHPVHNILNSLEDGVHYMLQLVNLGAEQVEVARFGLSAQIDQLANKVGGGDRTNAMYIDGLEEISGLASLEVNAGGLELSNHGLSRKQLVEKFFGQL
mmetsp:Transcript_27384/g.54828  ORF Transcript_27384/g.54828 Transcript_27384/m.54828 type:complete len:202 (+) Transcript_27384:202-807(+)